MHRLLVFQHVPHEILGTLDPLLRDAGFRIRYQNFGRQPDATPDLSRYHGLIVLGGPMYCDQVHHHPHLAVEVASIQLTDAVASIGGVFGLGSKYGKYDLVQTHEVFPFAVTNPVFIDRTLKSPLQQAKKSMPLGPSGVKHHKLGVGDLRSLFGSLHGH